MSCHHLFSFMPVQHLISAVMGTLWTLVFLLSTAVELPLLSAAPVRFTSYIPDGATSTGVTEQSTTTHMLRDTHDQHQLLQKNFKDEEDPRSSLEDYKPIDPSPDSDTSEVRPSPIENGENAPILDTTILEN